MFDPQSGVSSSQPVFNVMRNYFEKALCLRKPVYCLTGIKEDLLNYHPAQFTLECRASLVNAPYQCKNTLFYLKIDIRQGSKA